MDNKVLKSYISVANYLYKRVTLLEISVEELRAKDYSLEILAAVEWMLENRVEKIKLVEMRRIIQSVQQDLSLR